ncbi:uncharacterized protein LOC120284736 [Drosophila simulans]|uniref:uncharacterized protein LOC120284736 n=1 Tax=Drosophila simulans TaxID=7240 RepID=UPI00192CEAEB|nr:uncharacterized protein LOC120284736 [Drosophila simulans]
MCLISWGESKARLRQPQQQLGRALIYHATTTTRTTLQNQNLNLRVRDRDVQLREECSCQGFSFTPDIPGWTIHIFVSLDSRVSVKTQLVAENKYETIKWTVPKHEPEGYTNMRTNAIRPIRFDSIRELKLSVGRQRSTLA